MTRLSVLLLVPLGLFLGLRRAAPASADAPRAAAPAPDLQEERSDPENEPGEPTARILRGSSDTHGGGGGCPSDLVIELWPPNHKYVDIDLAAALPTTLGIEILGITQDEPVDERGDGHTRCDGDGVGSSVAHIRAERSGRQNGRVYEIEYSAFSGACTGIVTVTVPHDQSGAEAIDDGQDFDSTEGCK